MKKTRYKYKDIKPLIIEMFSFLEHEYGYEKPILPARGDLNVITYLSKETDIGIELCLDWRDNWFVIYIQKFDGVINSANYDFIKTQGVRTHLWQIIRTYFFEDTEEMKQIRNINQDISEGRVKNNLDTLVKIISLEQSLLHKYIGKIISDSDKILALKSRPFS